MKYRECFFIEAGAGGGCNEIISAKKSFFEANFTLISKKKRSIFWKSSWCRGVFRYLDSWNRWVYVPETKIQNVKTRFLKELGQYLCSKKSYSQLHFWNFFFQKRQKKYLKNFPFLVHPIMRALQGGLAWLGDPKKDNFSVFFWSFFRKNDQNVWCSISSSTCPIDLKLALKWS